MYNKSVVHSLLKRIWAKEFFPSPSRQGYVNGQDKEISLLIYDIFGGEILKTLQDKVWHFYNRVDGERLDFSNPTMVEITTDSSFKDILSYPEELQQYIDPDDYYTIYLSFTMTYEEILGLKCNHDYSKSNDVSVPAYLTKYHHEIAYSTLKPLIAHPVNPLSAGFL